MHLLDHKWNHVAAMAVGMACIAGTVRAQGALVTQGTVLATTGDVVNGGTGEVFGGVSGFGASGVDENGQVFFWSEMTGGGATNGANSKALFKGTTRANMTMFTRGESAAPGLPGIILSNAAGTASLGSSPRGSADGRVFFATFLKDPVTPLATTVDTALIGGVIGSFGVIVREGDPAPGTVGATLNDSFSNPNPAITGINRTGRVLFQSATSGGDTITAAAPAIANNIGWWTGIPGSLELMMRKGDSPPGAGGAIVNALAMSSQMNDSGQVVHSATLSTSLGASPATGFNDRILLVYTPGSPGTNAKIVREGDAAPGTAGATFNTAAAATWAPDIGYNAFNVNGEVAGWWSLQGGDVSGTTNDAALYRGSSSGLTMITRKGAVAPGTGGGTFSSVSTLSCSLNSSGKVAFQGTLVQAGAITATNDTGIWIGNEFGLNLIMQEGQPAPGLMGGEVVANMATATGIFPFHFNDLGQLLFQANLTGGTATAALYGWDPVLGLTLQYVNTDPLEVQPGVFKTANTWSGIQHNNGGGAGLCFNHSGKFVFRFIHTSGTTVMTGVVAHSTPRSAYCFGDGTDTTCPCANPGLAGRGCDNTAASGGALLSCSGGASITNDTLVLNGTFAVPFGPGLYYQGSTTANPTAPFGVAFGNGLRCAGGVTPRLEIVNPADATGASSTTVPIHTLGGITLPGTYYYQLWYRDSPNFGSCNSGFNFSNGISLAWAP